MKIKEQLLRIQASPYDDRGQRLEPEERPAERILVVDTPMKGNLDQQHHGHMRTSVNIQGNAHQFANGLRTMCAQCKHFDGDAWQKKKRQLSASKEGVQLLNGIRVEMINQGLGPATEMHSNEDELDLEHAISFMGFCRAQTEMHREEVLVHPMGGCPPEICTETSPLGYFEDANEATKRIGSAEYDRIMRQSQGKMP